MKVCRVCLVMLIALSLTACNLNLNIPFLKGRERVAVREQETKETYYEETEEILETTIEETTTQQETVDFDDVVARLLQLDKSEISKEVIEETFKQKIDSDSVITPPEEVVEEITETIKETMAETTVASKDNKSEVSISLYVEKLMTPKEFEDFYKEFKDDYNMTFDYFEIGTELNKKLSYNDLLSKVQNKQNYNRCRYEVLNTPEYFKDNKAQVYLWSPEELERKGNIVPEETSDSLPNETTISVVREKDYIDLADRRLLYAERYPELYKYEFKYTPPETTVPETTYKAETTNKTKTPEEKVTIMNTATRKYVLPYSNGFTASVMNSKQVTFKNNTTATISFDVYSCNASGAAQYIVIARDSLKLKYGEGDATKSASTVNNSYFKSVTKWVYTAALTNKEYTIAYDLELSKDEHLVVCNMSAADTIESNLSSIATGITCSLK